MPSAAVPRKPKSLPSDRERILIEFPQNLLKRADKAAQIMDKSRSDLIRTAVENLLDKIEADRFEQELAAAYKANSAMNLSLIEEFAYIDSEGL